MGQLLRLIIILFGVWLVIQIIKRSFASSASSSRAGRAKPAIPRMVACAHCGIHVPESEAIRDGDRFYCSQEHLSAARH